MVFTANVVASFFGSFEPCGPQPCPAEARKHPAVARRAPQAAPAPLRLPYFVILSVSEGSIWGKVTDSSSIFRSPQNDNAVFALNHFLSGTHSSARPGRLRGSHLRCEPARAQGLKPWHRLFRTREIAAMWGMLAIIVILNEVKNLFPCEPKAADGLCRARRRKTNEVQSNICIVSIQILRRYAPQNDKLLS